MVLIYPPEAKRMTNMIIPLREMNDRQALYSENNSEPQTGIEPATFWWDQTGIDPRLGLGIVFWVQGLTTIHLS